MRDTRKLTTLTRLYLAFSLLFFVVMIFLPDSVFAVTTPTATSATESVTNPSKAADKLQPLTVEFKQGLFSVQAKGVSLGEVLAEVEKQSGVVISVEESIKSRIVILGFSGLNITRTIEAITNAVGLGGYGISYKPGSTPGKIGQWVVDKVAFADKGGVVAARQKDVPPDNQQDKKIIASAATKKPKVIEKEPFFDKRLNRYVEVAKGEVLVRFSKDITKEQIEKFHKEEGTQTLKSYEKINVLRLKIPAAESVQEFVEKLSIDAKRTYIEPVFLASQQAVQVNDPSFIHQWSIPQIQADKAWDINNGSPDVIVAVIDTGIDIAHLDLKNKIVQGIDIVNGASNGIDDNGHGTHVAGIIAAESNNSIGIAGISWKSKLMSVKVITASGEGTYSDLIEGVIYAVDHGARVLNLSLGGYSHSQILGDAIQYAHSSKAVIVAAGGNENTNEPLYPAAYPNVIGVSATDTSDLRWSSSNFGSYVKLSAPGVGVLSTQKDNGYGKATGSSVATAHVSGVVALILSKNPDFSNTQVENILYQTADDLGDKGWDSYYGFGRVNALKAVEKASIEVHDVAITGIRIEPETFKKGEATKIVVTVENQGTFVEKGVVVKEQANGIVADNEQNISSIIPDEKIEVDFSWLPKIDGISSFRIEVQLNTIKGESDTEDNKYLKEFNAKKTDGQISIKHKSEPWMQTHQFMAGEAAKIWPGLEGSQLNDFSDWGSFFAGTHHEVWDYVGGQLTYTTEDDDPYFPDPVQVATYGGRSNDTNQPVHSSYTPPSGNTKGVPYSDFNFESYQKDDLEGDIDHPNNNNTAGARWNGGNDIIEGVHEEDVFDPLNHHNHNDIYYNTALDITGTYMFAEHLWKPDVYNADSTAGGVTDSGYFDRGLDGGSEMGGADPFHGVHRSAYSKAQDYWNNYVIPNYKNGHKDLSYYYFGRVVHLFEDMSSVPHVHNELHGVPGFANNYEEENGKVANYTNWSKYDHSMSGSLIDYSNISAKILNEWYCHSSKAFSDDCVMVPVPDTQDWPLWSHLQDAKNAFYSMTPLFRLFYSMAETTDDFPSDMEPGDIITDPTSWTDILNSDIPINYNDKSIFGVDGSTGIESFYIGASKPLRGLDNAVITGMHYNVEEFSRYIQPIALRHIAGLYRLFWDETHLGEVDYYDSNKSSFPGMGQLFRDEYTLNGGISKIGYVTNFVHKWGNYWVQDFRPMKDGNGNEIGGFGSSIMIYNPDINKVYTVHGDIWKHTTECTYECMSGPGSWLGPPVGDEVTNDPTYGKIQKFKNGYITHKNDGGDWWNAYPNDTLSTVYTLSVSKTGTGTVTSNPSGISCGSTCSANYTSGTPVSLTVIASSGYTFSGWGGVCRGTGNCTVTMSSDKSVTATFTVSASGGTVPTVTTSTASSITSTGATISGSVNPNGSSTTTWFEYGTSSTLSIYNSTTASLPFTSISTTQSALSGLNPSTIYYYRIAASNSAGTSRGTISNFTTLSSSTTQTELIINGSFSSGISGWTRQGVDSWAGTNLTNYRISDGTTGYAALGVDSTGTPKNGADGAFYQTVSIPANATAATLGFWYYISTNETGSTANDELYVSVRDSSGNFLAYAATLSNINKTTGYVQKTFDLSPYIGQTIRIRFGATTDLLNTTTTFRIDDVSIAVSYSAPSVYTSNASTTSTSATLNGNVIPTLPYGSSTTAWFEWGTNPTLSTYTSTTSQSIVSGSTTVSGSTPQSVIASLGGLSPSTTYYYRIAASNNVGTSRGSIVSFSTPAAPVTIRTLTVVSSNPSSGVSITVSPNDNNGLGSGATQFTRTYNNNTAVSLAAPSSSGGNNFQKWQRNGVDYSTNSSTSVTMDANYTMTAVYAASTAQYQLTTSVGPSGAGSVSPNCSGGCWYNSGASVTLTATANSGYNFSYWSGCDSSSGATCYANINLNKNVMAIFTAAGGVVTLAAGLSNPNDIAIDDTSVYWTEYGSGTVKKVSKSGGSVTTLASGLYSVSGLALDNNYVYFAENVGSGAANLKKVLKSGGSVTTLASGQTSAWKIAVDGANVYWTDGEGGTIRKVPVNGGSVSTLATGSLGAAGIAVDSTAVYWSEFTNPGSVKKVPLNGGSVTTLASNSNTPGIAVDSANVYWTEYVYTNNGKVNVSVNGGSVASLATGLTSPWDVAVDGANAYWVENFSGGAVKQVPLGGGSIVTLLSGLAEPVAIAVDSTNVYWIERNSGGGSTGGTVKMIAKGTSIPDIITYTVTPLASTGGSISPSTPQTVNSGASASFTLTPNTGYFLSWKTGTTCSGTLVGNTYTTGAITGDCTVTAAFAVIPAFAVTSKPTGVSASAGNGQAIISWSLTEAQLMGLDCLRNGVSGCSVSYNIYWSTSSGVSKTSGTKISNATMPYTHTGLTNGMQYYYVITAVNSYGESAESTQVSATPASGITYTVTPLASTGGSISPSTPQTVNSGASASFTLTPNTGYFLSWITGTTCSGTLVGNTYTTGAITGDCTVTVAFAVTPKPTGVSVSAGNGQAIISWSLTEAQIVELDCLRNRVSGCSVSYNIYWSTSSGVSKTSGTKISNATMPYTHTGLTNGTQYYYVVTAVNSYGESAESTQVSATPTAPAPDGISTPSSDTRKAGIEREDAGDSSNNLGIDLSKPKIDITFNFGIVLKDPTGNVPQYIRLYITQRSAPTAADFYPVDLTCIGFWDAGATCSYPTLLGPAANHKYYFEVKLANGTVLRYPATGEIAGPVAELLTGYNMVSVPRDVAGAKLDGAAAFGNSLTYKWNSTGLTTDGNQGGYAPVDSSNPIKPGEGYFTVKGSGATTLPELELYNDILAASYTITLSPGWNMISNPYGGPVKLSAALVQKGSGAPVSWTQAATNGYVVNAIYYYKGSDWGSTYNPESAGGIPDATLVPWVGYWVYLNKNDDAYKLIITRP